jgi:succinate-semialdehyde dehydrogenase/glutarate-semialdehyde dehydrogenase
MATLTAVNPATEAVIRTYEPHDAAHVEETLAKASRAQRAWATTPVAERTARLRDVASVLRRRQDELAATMTAEMGKPILQSRAEVEKCARVCEYYAENAPAFLAPETVPTEAARSQVFFQPLGLILAVMPWNFPLWQVFRFAAPALAGGNGGILKHASNVPGCALAVEDVFREAGLPPDIFRTLLVGSSVVQSIVEDPRVAAVTLTGSEPAGRAVAKIAGRALKKTVLELGGSDPFIILADADLDAAVEGAVASRTLNAGQSCIAAKRFIVEAPVLEPFLSRFTAAMEALVVGDPLHEETNLGPLARADIVVELHDQVTRSVAAGARLLTGGRPLEGPGFFYPPTVLADIGRGMPAWDEETFGPVAAVARADDPEHAVALANETGFGLGASIWGADLPRAGALAARIEAGVVFVNAFVKSDPRLPFGGIKRSGYGRELSAWGMREFQNVKTVWIE